MSILGHGSMIQDPLDRILATPNFTASINGQIVMSLKRYFPKASILYVNPRIMTVVIGRALTPTANQCGLISITVSDWSIIGSSRGMSGNGRFILESSN